MLYVICIKQDEETRCEETISFFLNEQDIIDVIAKRDSKYEYSEKCTPQTFLMENIFNSSIDYSSKLKQNGYVGIIDEGIYWGIGIDEEHAGLGLRECITLYENYYNKCIDVYRSILKNRAI
jgi:hypothetical protein